MRWNSLATRLIVAFAASILAATVVVVGFSLYQARDALRKSLLGHGRMLMEEMETYAGNHLVQYDYAYLRDYVSDVTNRVPMISFAAIMNADGTVVAHSDHEKEGKTWSDPAGKAAGKTAGHEIAERMISYKDRSVLEMTAPVVIGGKRWGTVQFGLNYKDVDAALRRLMVSLALAGLLVLAATTAGVRALTARITADLGALVRITREISEGELRSQVPEEGLDEIRSLARAFNTMAENLRATLRQVQEASVTVGNFSSNILGVIQEQATNAAQQAASVSEITATVEELSRTSRQISGNAEAVKNAAVKTVEVAQGGTAIVRDAAAAMEEIKDHVGDIARKTLFLGEKSHEIGKVMDIIKEIAGEIHLLALNAAIESAAAGEYGRRFSVVASEVRRLADKTRESTETIRAIISEIQSATNASIQATEHGSREVDRWQDMIKASSGNFEEIIRMIEKTSEASMQISLATHQQTTANEQVVQAMHQIAEMVRLTASHMKESSTSASELKGMVGTLRETAAVFRV